MRFVYDKQKQTKRKIKSPIIFPKSINMASFIKSEQSISLDDNNAGDDNSNLMYDLSAVLLHRGASAYSGHFIAIVHDHELSLRLVS